MHKAPDQIPGNIDVAAQELLEAAAANRVAMLGGIAKALTKRLQDNPGIGAREVSERVTAFVKAVRDRLEIAANSWVIEGSFSAPPLLPFSTIAPSCAGKTQFVAYSLEFRNWSFHDHYWWQSHQIASNAIKELDKPGGMALLAWTGHASTHQRY
jgi:hypothetical protein